MPILRRYVRVSKYTVLEARVFLPNPTDVPWFTRTDAVERVFAEVKHLVLPMLAEARNLRGAARVKAKDKEVVVGGKYILTYPTTCTTDLRLWSGADLSGGSEDFEVSIYLTGAGSLHAVLRKNRAVELKQPIESNSTKLTGTMSESPVVIRDEEESHTPDIMDISEAPVEAPLFLPAPDDEDSEGDFVPLPQTPQPRNWGAGEPEEDKKHRFRTEYEGFTIYDRVLCLVVTRREKRKEKAVGAPKQEVGLIEGWIVMSQAVRDGGGDGDAGGE